MTAPALDDNLRLAESVEDLAVEQLVPEPGIEAQRGFPQPSESKGRGQALEANESLSASALLARMETVSRALSKLGNDVVARMAQEVVRGAGVVRLQFLASEFYEAVKAELDQTFGTRPVGLGRLRLS